MLRLVADVDIEGQVGALVTLLKRPEWLNYWEFLDVHVSTFSDLGLSHDSSDRIVWNTIQLHDAILITGNRNRDGKDSLQATIEDSNTALSMPVFTISNAQRFQMDRPYAIRVAERLIEYLFDIEQHRGTGRLYIP